MHYKGCNIVEIKCYSSKNENNALKRLYRFLIKTCPINYSIVVVYQTIFWNVVRKKCVVHLSLRRKIMLGFQSQVFSMTFHYPTIASLGAWKSFNCSIFSLFINLAYYLSSYFYGHHQKNSNLFKDVSPRADS